MSIQVSTSSCEGSTTNLDGAVQKSATWSWLGTVAGPFAGMAFQPGDWFVFGPETRGLSEERREWFPASQRIRLPMRPDNRSLNLSNTVAVVVFEAWRQNGFAGGA